MEHMLHATLISIILHIIRVWVWGEYSLEDLHNYPGKRIPLASSKDSMPIKSCNSSKAYKTPTSTDKQNFSKLLMKNFPH